MTTRLRLGILGLGRRWRQCRAALAELAGETVVRAVCDPSAARAERVARALGCAAAAGPVELLERDDVQAVLLLDRGWYRLWPLAHACRVGKPVFCAPSLAGDDAHADEMHTQIESSRLPVMMALGAAGPAVERLSRLLAESLGPARVVRGWRVLARPGRPALRPATALALLHGAAELLGPPGHVGTAAVEEAGFASLVLGYGDGRAAQLSLWPGAGRGAGCRFEVTAERGLARVDSPFALRWRDAEGLHVQRWPRRSLARRLLGSFVEAVRRSEPLRPNFADAHRALTWLRTTRRKP
jgi:predicted dehydrogenase